MNRDFKGVWIPKEIWINKDLTWMEKLFFVEIYSLDNEEGCFASNSYLGEFFSLTPMRCSQIVNSLIKKEYLSAKYEKEGKVIKRRVLNIFNRGIKYSKLGIKNPLGGIKNIKGGYKENAKDNNTKSNNTSNNTINNTEKNSLHTQLKQIHFDWHKKEVELVPLFDGSDAKSLNIIINNLKENAKRGGKVESVDQIVVDSWKWILKNYKKWDSKGKDYYQKQTRIRQIGSHLTNILINLKYETGTYTTADGSKVSEEWLNELFKDTTYRQV